MPSTLEHKHVRFLGIHYFVDSTCGHGWNIHGMAYELCKQRNNNLTPPNTNLNYLEATGKTIHCLQMDMYYFENTLKSYKFSLSLQLQNCFHVGILSTVDHF